MLDGWHRYQACTKIGIKGYGEPYTGSNPAAYVCSANLHRRQLNMTPAQKRKLIATVLKEKPELSDRQVAKLTGANRETVGSERTNLGDVAETSHVVDTKGRKQPVRKATKTKPRQATVKTPTEEITGVPEPTPVRMTARERVYQVLDAWDEELVLELRVPAERREFHPPHDEHRRAGPGAAGAHRRPARP